MPIERKEFHFARTRFKRQERVRGVKNRPAVTWVSEHAIEVVETAPHPIHDVCAPKRDRRHLYIASSDLFRDDGAVPIANTVDIFASMDAIRTRDHAPMFPDRTVKKRGYGLIIERRSVVIRKDGFDLATDLPTSHGVVRPGREELVEQTRTHENLLKELRIDEGQYAKNPLSRERGLD